MSTMPSGPRGTVPASTDPNFDPLGPWRKKQSSLTDDGTNAKATQVLTAVDTLVTNVTLQLSAAQDKIEASWAGYFGGAAQVGSWVQATAPLFVAQRQCLDLLRLLAEYRANVVTWAANHDLYRTSGVTPPAMPEPSGDLLVYMPGLVF